MGTCVSRPENCVGGRKLRSSKRKLRRRRKSVKHGRLDRSLNKVDAADRSSNSTIHASVDEAWHDSVAIFEDQSDEEFQSVREGSFLTFIYCTTLSHYSK
jgi:hypothetical protein